MTTTEINVALVGGGLIARAHAAAMRALPIVLPDAPRPRPLVVCDATAELARAAAERLAFDDWSDDWAATVQRADVDMVVVATPPDLHAPVVMAALEAGKHVLCEKPLARNAAEARPLWDAARAHPDLVTAVGCNMRQAPALLQARAWLRAGVLGDIVHVTGRFFQDHGRDASRPMAWRYQAARAGSGALGDVGSHLVDALRWLIGDLHAVSGLSRTVVSERPSAGGQERVDVDDWAGFLVRFASGAAGTCEVSRVATGRKNQMALEVTGSRGSLAFDWERSNELLLYSADDPPDRQGFRTVRVGPAQPAYPALIPLPGLGIGFIETFIQQAATFTRAVDGQPPVEPTATLASFEDGLRVCEALDAVVESARTQAWTAITKGESAA